MGIIHNSNDLIFFSPLLVNFSIRNTQREWYGWLPLPRHYKRYGYETIFSVTIFVFFFRWKSADLLWEQAVDWAPHFCDIAIVNCSIRFWMLPLLLVLPSLLCVFCASFFLLKRSNCTKAEGWDLLDSNVLPAIKRKMESSKLYYNFLFSIHQTNVKYPVPPEEEEKRWQSIVTKSLNAKCRGARASKRRQQLRINSTCTNSETALHVHRHWFFVVRCSMLYAFVVCQGNLTKST